MRILRLAVLAVLALAACSRPAASVTTGLGTPSDAVTRALLTPADLGDRDLALDQAPFLPALPCQDRDSTFAALSVTAVAFASADGVRASERILEFADAARAADAWQQMNLAMSCPSVTVAGTGYSVANQMLTSSCAFWTEGAVTCSGPASGHDAQTWYLTNQSDPTSPTGKGLHHPSGSGR